MSNVVEFTMNVKPGHYAEVVELYSEFACEFQLIDPSLHTVHILGDEGSGVVRGIGIFDARVAANEVNSNALFAAFNDAVAPLISGEPTRVVLDLLHGWTR